MLIINDEELIGEINEGRIWLEEKHINIEDIEAAIKEWRHHHQKLENNH